MSKAGKMILPREHGSWALLYGPFLIVVLAFGSFDFRTLILLVSLTALFLTHEPLAKLARTPSGIVGPHRVRHWRRWLLIYGGIGLLSGLWLLIAYQLWLLIPAGILIGGFLLLNLYLVSRKQDRQLLPELLGVLGLTTSGPVTYYVVTGRLDYNAFLTWVLCLLYFSSAVFYVKMRVSRFTGKKEASLRTAVCIGYHVFLLLVLGGIVQAGWISGWIIAGFIPLIVRSVWPLVKPDKRLNFKMMGYSEVAYTLVFVIAAGFTLSA